MGTFEIARFALKSGATEQELIAVEQLIKTGIITQQPGFKSRQLMRSERGGWVLLMHWDSIEAAEAWGPRLMQDPNGPAFVALLDMSSLQKEYCTVV